MSCFALEQNSIHHRVLEIKIFVYLTLYTCPTDFFLHDYGKKLINAKINEINNY